MVVAVSQDTQKEETEQAPDPTTQGCTYKGRCQSAQPFCGKAGKCLTCIYDSSTDCRSYPVGAPCSDHSRCRSTESQPAVAEDSCEDYLKDLVPSSAEIAGAYNDIREWITWSTPRIWPNLRKGDGNPTKKVPEGSAKLIRARKRVCALKLYLRKRNYYRKGSEGPVFDEVTAELLAQFQEHNNLPKTGFFDWRTRRLLAKDVSARNIPAPVRPIAGSGGVLRTPDDTRIIRYVWKVPRTKEGRPPIFADIDYYILRRWRNTTCKGGDYTTTYISHNAGAYEGYFNTMVYDFSPDEDEPDTQSFTVRSAYKGVANAGKAPCVQVEKGAPEVPPLTEEGGAETTSSALATVISQLTVIIGKYNNYVLTIEAGSPPPFSVPKGHKAWITLYTDSACTALAQTRTRKAYNDVKLNGGDAFHSSVAIRSDKDRDFDAYHYQIALVPVSASGDEFIPVQTSDCIEGPLIEGGRSELNLANLFRAAEGEQDSDPTTPSCKYPGSCKSTQPFCGNAGTCLTCVYDSSTDCRSYPVSASCSENSDCQSASSQGQRQEPGPTEEEALRDPTSQPSQERKDAQGEEAEQTPNPTTPSCKYPGPCQSTQPFCGNANKCLTCVYDSSTDCRSYPVSASCSENSDCQSTSPQEQEAVQEEEGEVPQEPISACPGPNQQCRNGVCSWRDWWSLVFPKKNCSNGWCTHGRVCVAGESDTDLQATPNQYEAVTFENQSAATEADIALANNVYEALQPLLTDVNRNRVPLLPDALLALKIPRVREYITSGAIVTDITKHLSDD